LAAFEKIANELDEKAHALAQTQKKTVGWKQPLTLDDTQNALASAQAFEKSIFRFFQPSFWRLKKTLEQRYDFAQHAVAPRWSKILRELAAQHEAQAALDAARERAGKEWQCENAEAFRSSVTDLRSDPRTAHASIKALLQQLMKS